jgi:sulfite reductase alpha subunit-like flavoprotein
VGKELAYDAGDHLGIYPENQLDCVLRVAALLRVDPEAVFSLHLADSKDGVLEILVPIYS